jgi:uncharacterized membrane protein YdfJ with MMPL/SSD domain
MNGSARGTALVAGVAALMVAFIAAHVIQVVGFLGFMSMLLKAFGTLLTTAAVLVGFGAVLMFGILGYNDIPLNPANMIVLPLILGIGIDDGVHVVHDYRRQRGGYQLGASTASGIVVTSLTTMIGFGSLMLAEHRGLASLGRVLTIGVACCLFTSLIMLPAILTLIAPRRSSEEPAARKTNRTSDRSDPPGIDAAPGVDHPGGKQGHVGQQLGSPPICPPELFTTVTVQTSAQRRRHPCGARPCGRGSRPGRSQ